MPAQVFTDKMLDYMRQRMRTIAESNALLTNQLNSASVAQVTAHVALVDSMIAGINTALSALDAKYAALKSDEEARLNTELAELEEFKIRLQNINS